MGLLLLVVNQIVIREVKEKTTLLLFDESDIVLSFYYVSFHLILTKDTCEVVSMIPALWRRLRL